MEATLSLCPLDPLPRRPLGGVHLRWPCPASAPPHPRSCVQGLNEFAVRRVLKPDRFYNFSLFREAGYCFVTRSEGGDGQRGAGVGLGHGGGMGRAVHEVEGWASRRYGRSRKAVGSASAVPFPY